MIKKPHRQAYSLALILVILISSGCSRNETETGIESMEMSVREILELPTYEQIYRDIVYVGEYEKVLFFTTTDKEVLFAIDIRIQAGIRNVDLIDIEITGEKENGTRLARVSIPKAEILLIDADESSIKQYFIKERGGVISRLEYYDEINRKKEMLLQDEFKIEIVQQASLNAQQLISSFLALSNIEIIEFREAASEL